MRILHITRDFPPRSNGGLSTAVGGLVRAQARAGIECLVVSFDAYRPRSSGGGATRKAERTRTDAGVPVVHVASVEALGHATELAAEVAADAVHVHHEMLWDFGSEVARRHDSPTVYSIHVLQSEQNRLRDVESTQSSEAQTRALAECSVIHAPSRAVAGAVALRDPDLRGRLEVAALGTEQWPDGVASSQRNPFEGPPLLLYVGRFADINGFGDLLEALPQVLAEHPELRVVAAGGLPDNPRSEKRWRKRWQRLAGAQEHRLELLGWLSRPELSALYGRATMLIVPSWFETFGQVVLEGMVHGTPIITTGAGALAELVDESSALLIEPQSAAAIAGAVTQLLENPDAAEARRAQALDKARDGYHWDDRLPALVELYERARLG